MKGNKNWAFLGIKHVERFICCTDRVYQSIGYDGKNTNEKSYANLYKRKSFLCEHRYFIGLDVNLVQIQVHYLQPNKLNA
jgi:hypothetical protein